MITGNVYFQVLGTGSFSTPSVVVCTDNERLLFDCGDGTQRLCVEHGLKIAKCNRIYLTSTHPDQTGGLGGFLLTRSDLPLAQETVIAGPPRTGALVKSFKHFYHRPHCQLNVFEIGCGGDNFPGTTRDGIDVVPILIGGRSTSTGITDGEAEDGAKRAKASAASPPSSFSSSSSSSETGRGFQLYEAKREHDTAAASYIIRLPERRGKFHPQKALALGIQAGKNFGRLTRGEPVFSPKLGRMVTSAECQDDPEPAPHALILACPTVEHLECLKNSGSELHAALASAAAGASPLQVVFHLTNKEVFSRPDYSEWVRQTFASSPATQHVLMGEGLTANTTMLPSSCRLQMRLNYVDAESFPSVEPTTTTTTEDDDDDDDGFLRALPRSRFHLSPPKQVGYDRSLCLADVVRADERAAAEDLLKDLEPVPSSSSSSSPSPASSSSSIHELLFLGTGSAMPSKYRNVTGMFLRGEAGEGGILLDCGEASLSQLARALGSTERARVEVHKLKFVWISHIHADHHLGLLAVLAERQRHAGCRPLIVVGPQQLNYFLRDFAESQAPGGGGARQFLSSFVFLDCEALFRDKEFTAPALSELKQLANLESAVAVLVPHCHKSYGLVLRSRAGWSLTWSGDTEYCAELVKEGQGCDVLVHEATFEDAKANEAREKKHSTLSTAVRAGREMGVRHLVFTHFSQRYPKCPPPVDLSTSRQGGEDEDFTMTAVFAFDLMRFQPSRAHLLSAKTAHIQALFAEEEEEEQEDEEAEEED